MTPDARPVTVRHTILVVLAFLVFASGCAEHSMSAAATQAQRGVPSYAAASSHRSVAGIGSPGAYQVGHRRMTFLEPAHTGPTGQFLDQRALVIVIWYPLARRSAGSPAAHGPFPLLVFAPGFMQCGVPYEDLLRAWAGAGYVVAVVNFPRTDCSVGAAAYEPDLVNQPGGHVVRAQQAAGPERGAP